MNKNIDNCFSNYKQIWNFKCWLIWELKVRGDYNKYSDIKKDFKK